jgi:quaternary ammonium compound-resistance protein SugE
MKSAWIFLCLAGLLEIGWPVGLKIAQTPGRVLAGVALAVVCMGLSGWFLWLAQKGIPIGTAYAVWTGIGATGTFLIGVAFYGDPSGLLRWLAIFLIISGIVLLKLAH